MRSFIALSIFVSGALSAVLPRATGDTENGMQDVIDGTSDCLPVAAIFARGTTEVGNVGAWVGPNIMEALGENVAKQGVSRDAYPAVLVDFYAEGGSNSGAQGLADTVQSYVDKCPDAAVVIIGWSQGALVAHKGLGLLDAATVEKNVAGLVTFGDPWDLFDHDTMPIDESLFYTVCEHGDLLCDELPEGFLPPTLDQIAHMFDVLPEAAQGEAEIEAAAQGIKLIPGQLADAWPAIKDTIAAGEYQRLMVTPQHLVYGNNGNAAEAGAWALELPKVKAALGA
ncbi:carbohydrate esterase family 5 protein [Cylindrobasidium torrendii FP15055 ss-10]|uniref:cutinase n=1 Tax=Cylindrobasidium torrendii FP15055 ss-10 TaxID=1314674 RepID=A0A0D7B597_9AGAR|nr:carbohydrate esterase family 5 protein [Cylindrobasidium torrendii FP15055 ss-10]